MTRKFSKWRKNFQNDAKIFKMMQKNSKWCKKFQNDAKIFKMMLKFLKLMQKFQKIFQKFERQTSEALYSHSSENNDIKSLIFHKGNKIKIWMKNVKFLPVTKVNLFSLHSSIIESFLYYDKLMDEWKIFLHSVFIE